MSHMIALPILLPLLIGSGLLVSHRQGTPPQRLVSICNSLALILISLLLLEQAASGAFQVYALGNWPPPFGIVLVLDRLSALMLVLTSVLAFFALLFATTGEDSKGPYFHALFQFQLMGLNGAFLTGDLFNLFVFFEVLLIASYALLLHGGGRARSAAGLHYVALNLVGSLLFLIALGILYGTLGTLNMADLAQRVAQASPDQIPLVRAAGLTLLVVFGLKAALLPLLFWLPKAYAAAPAPVAALFAIMTKVGVYAIIRVFTLIFGPLAGPLAGLAEPLLLPLGLATLAVGVLGVLAADSLRRLLAWLVVISAGTLMASFAPATTESLSATLYYLLHTTLAVGAFFLMAGLLAEQRGSAGDRLVIAPPLRNGLALSLLYALGVMAVVGLPPFSGFVAKLMILEAVLPSASVAWLWGLILGGGLLTLMAMSRAGTQLFWHHSEGQLQSSPPLSTLALTAACGLALASPVLALTAAPVASYTTETAQQLRTPDLYIQSVLGARAPSPAEDTP